MNMKSTLNTQRWKGSRARMTCSHHEKWPNLSIETANDVRWMVEASRDCEIID